MAASEDNDSLLQEIQVMTLQELLWKIQFFFSSLTVDERDYCVFIGTLKRK